MCSRWWWPRFPRPAETWQAPLRALIFDSKYDSFRGVVVYVRVIDGELKRGDKIRIMATGAEYEVSEVGYFNPRLCQVDRLSAGEVGYVVASIKEIARRARGRHGHPRAARRNPGAARLQGGAADRLRRASIPINVDDYDDLKDAIEKLKLNDALLQSRRRPPSRSASGSAAGSSGCSTWRSCRSASSASLTSSLLTTAPSVIYQCSRATARC